MPRNGNTTRRGYGWTHQDTRARLAPTVQAGRATCWRCHRRIPPTPPEHACRKGCRAPWCWDLGHDDHDRSVTRGPEHRHRLPGVCPGNRSKGASNGNRKRAATAPQRPRPRRRAPQPDGPTLVDDDW